MTTYQTEQPFTANQFVADLDDGVISRHIFVDEGIFRSELRSLFPNVWLFIGHASQVPNVGDFFVSRMGVDSVLMTRDD
ncbi:MAG TPA: hypothetical protein VLJ88_01885, partial [Propionibacteriaceae bacterium]|nr:hypothetical protein [Propionibacteriaceae bacterium]